jgi:hypothetical protein
MGAKTLRAAVLLAVGFVGTFLTAHYGDARNSPPRPQPKSPAAGHLRFFRQSLKSPEIGWFFKPPMDRYVARIKKEGRRAPAGFLERNLVHGDFSMATWADREVF